MCSGLACMKSMAAALLINVLSEHPNITSDLSVGLVDLKKILEIDFTDFPYQWWNFQKFLAKSPIIQKAPLTQELSNADFN